MPSQIYFENHLLTNIDAQDVLTLKTGISLTYGLHVDDLFATINGKVLGNDVNLKNSDNVVRVFAKLVGGKGGFGSMLRAIGAQIEKTTNREACRDLSGRRLRDINEEKRLRKWLEGQEDREREAVERKQKKIEKLLAEPKISVKLSEGYHKEREELPERVSQAVDAGWEAAGSSTAGSLKRKSEEKPKTSKKAKLWIDADLSDCTTSEDEEDEEEKEKAEPKETEEQTVTTDSGNESDRVSEVSKSSCA